MGAYRYQERGTLHIRSRIGSKPVNHVRVVDHIRIRSVAPFNVLHIVKLKHKVARQHVLNVRLEVLTPRIIQCEGHETMVMRHDQVTQRQVRGSWKDGVEIQHNFL